MWKPWNKRLKHSTISPMLNRRYLNRQQNNTTGRERRELRFADPAPERQVPEAVQKALDKRKAFLDAAYGEASDKAEKVAGNVPVENLQVGVNEQRQTSINQIGETLFFDEDAPTPEIEEAKAIGQGLVMKYQDWLAEQGADAFRLQGLRFAVKASGQGAETKYGLRVFGADIEFIKFALADVATQARYLENPPEATVMTARRKYESDEDYAVRAEH